MPNHSISAEMLAKDDSASTVQTTERRYNTGIAAVRKARRFALQGLYEWLITDYRFQTDPQKAEWCGNTPEHIAARTRSTNAMHTVHLGYYHEIMANIPRQIDELTALIDVQLDRPIARLDNIEYAALLIGVYELKHSLHIPYKVVIDEIIELNNYFGATEGFKLINAVLDNLAQTQRSTEIAAMQAEAAQKAGVKKIQRKQSKAALMQAAAQAQDDVQNAQDAMQNDTQNDIATANPAPRLSLQALTSRGKKSPQQTTSKKVADKHSADGVNSTKKSGGKKSAAAKTTKKSGQAKADKAIDDNAPLDEKSSKKLAKKLPQKPAKKSLPDLN